jgi:serine beta-lactamase-like protein LACTB, mitochondrial
VAFRWNRIETWLTLAVAGAGLIILGVAGLWLYMSATAKPLHPDAASVSSIPHAEPAQQWRDAIDRARQIARAGTSEQNLPGVSVAVGVNGALVWAEGFGWADVEAKTPVTPGTRFRIGTISMPLTSAGVGLLVEKGRLQLDDPIQKYVPEFPQTKWPVTVRQLMAHTSGMRSDGGDEGPLFSKHCDRPVDALPEVVSSELRFEPGTEYRYGRYSFIAVSAAIESAAGEPFLTFMQKQIFDPLRMDNTMPEPDTDPVEDLATPYFPKFAGDPRYGNDLMRPLQFSCYAGASVFLSTPVDLVRFVLALHGGKLLQPATVQMLQTPQRTTSGQETGYGLGWDLEDVTLSGKPARTIGHDGEVLGGISSSLLMVPEHNIVVAVVSNTSYGDVPGVAAKIAETFMQQRK